MGAYEATHQQSLQNPEAFWRAAARLIDWEVEPGDRILEAGNAPFYRWFPDGVLNTCHNAVDRHAVGSAGEKVALVYDSPMTGSQRRYTYGELLDQVARFAGVLSGLGVEPGDRVVVYMPMVPEAVIAMLACARIGAIHSVVFGGFAAHELALRIDHARPKVVVSASCGLEPGRVIQYKPLLDAALDEATHRVDRCVILQRPEAPADLAGPRDLDWNEQMTKAEAVACTPVRATDPLYILYTSGTTGRPKGVVRDHGGHAVALAWSMGNVYGVTPEDTFWAASDIGWVVGHSYIVYAPLLIGATTVLYEGKPVGTPDPGAFWRVVDDHRVNVLFTAPTALRAIRKEDPGANHLSSHDVSSLRALFVAGERLDPDTYTWASQVLARPVIDHWWQTETGWPMAANCLGIEALPVKPGSPTRPVPGWDVRVLDSEGDECPPDAEGSVAVKLPLPPGSLPTLYEDDERYVASYLKRYPGFYLTGDGGYVDGDGYLFVMGRTDDVINVAGHRLSTGAIEQALATHSDVAECAVIGVPDDLKGQVPVGLAVLKAGVDRDPVDLEGELIRIVRERVGAIAAPKRVLVVGRLPKTRSGKILRSTMRGLAEGRSPEVPSTIEDIAVIDELRSTLTGLSDKDR